MIEPYIGTKPSGGQVGRVHAYDPRNGQESGDVDCTSLGPLLAWVMEITLY